MRKKQKPKHSFGFETTSRGPDNKPFNMETELLELLVHFRMQRESHHGKRQLTEVRNASQGPDSKCHSKDENTTSRTMSNSKYKRLGAGKSNVSSSKSAEGEDEFKADEVFDHETRRPKLTKQGAVDNMTQLRDFSRENGPSEEHDLRKALSISEVQMILDMHGAITAFSDCSPPFEYLYTFVCYNCIDEEDDRLAETFTELLNNGILHDAIAGDGVRQGKSVLSSDSSVYVSAGGGGDNEPASCKTKNASSQIPSLHLHHFRALQSMQQTCDAKVQTEIFQPARITESKSGQQKCDVKITHLKHRPNVIS
ncbi:hypothetical protein HPB51_024891 [Rhipicephalus microplus]|uniref:Uncharacterized protein n=1 Tax=Rhipicephalus microplus TaxID=6941 RepID=A0A9J6EQA3_RHIMP|nr:hypothetical protein HPB51_024891 [Rhipicephalus microplus]